MAYPETLVIDGGCCAGNQALAKDFSAYYTGAWRLLHAPSQVYTRGHVNDGEPLIPPEPEQYKNLPSLLLLILPLLALPYHDALTAFDIIQFLLLPAMALLLYQLLRGKGGTTLLLVSLGVLLLPLPFDAPQWGISAAYYWQWAEGQSKVLETFLLLLSFYLARSGRPRFSGAVFALGAFDPRISVLGFPLFLALNSDRRSSLTAAGAALVALNLPLFYPPLTAGFVSMVLTTGVSTPPYYYTFIPLITIASLTAVEWNSVAGVVRRWLSAMRRRDNRPELSQP